MSIKVIRQNALLLIIPALLVSVFACMVCYLGSIVTGEIPMTTIAGQVVGAVIAPLFGIQELFVNELAGQIIKALAFVLGLHAVGLVFLSGICYLVFSHKLHHVLLYRIVMAAILAYAAIPWEDCCQYFLTSLQNGPIQFWLLFYIPMTVICAFICGWNTYTRRILAKDENGTQQKKGSRNDAL